jgi:hypothetical protein
MAEPITDLTANWVDGTSIDLKWTAAADVSTGSTYNVYILQGTKNIIPFWFLLNSTTSSLVYNAKFSNYSLTAPVTYYNLPWEKYQLFLSNGLIAPNSVAFQIVHVDSTGAESIPTNISVYPGQITKKYGQLHFSNTIKIDPFGQFVLNPQNSYEEISSSVAMFMGTELGQRTAVPSYGLQDLPFNDISIKEIQRQISKWEPRANVAIDIIYDNNNQATLNVKVSTTSGGA